MASDFHHESVLLDATMDALPSDGTIWTAHSAVADMRAQSLRRVRRMARWSVSTATPMRWPLHQKTPKPRRAFQTHSWHLRRHGGHWHRNGDHSTASSSILGVSSPQLDRPERGFSLRSDGPVDMRMDTSQTLDAATLIDDISLTELVGILGATAKNRAKQIARAIIEGRPWSSTKLWQTASPRPPAIETAEPILQHEAFRRSMAVNDELGQLERGLDAAIGMLAPGGRLAVISFHSSGRSMCQTTIPRGGRRKQPKKDPYGQPSTPPPTASPTARALPEGRRSGQPRSRSARCAPSNTHH